ncbi:hypothetical protein [uncultured Allomuricauda sp.]|uniref:hypothetical protein n=1 Tax=Flagellimonas sp. W118 TaxID=3410791 RepID=UPI00260B6E29|nr:hypothetical protein [uncultured Allomuricauda sp.]
MPLKSNFKADLAKEKRLSILLDSYYQKNLKFYDFERTQHLKQQLDGIDLVLKNKTTQQVHFVDEKAQLDYINESLPTFAFELLYQKNGAEKPGWLFDKKKQTHFYALATNIFSDEKGIYTSCNVTFVNRQKLISYLIERGLTLHLLQKTISANKSLHGKLVMDNLDPKTEGYLFFSRKNKAENPINLVLRLEFLLKIGVGKQLV